MKVLVTGATGFLGRPVVRRLAIEGHTLFALARPNGEVESLAAYLAGVRRGDITDPLAMARAADGVEAIVHLAAEISHWPARRNAMMRTNAYGTRVVAEAAKTAGVERFLHCSSVSAVGYSSDGNPLDETATNNFPPLHLAYHESKRIAEEEALDVRHYGVHVAIVNPSFIYGPREPGTRPMSQALLEIATGRAPAHPTGGLCVVGVVEAGAGIAAALLRARDGERYILGAENVRYGELFARAARQAGTVYRGRAIPAAVLRAAAFACDVRARFDGREPLLTRDAALVAPLFTWFSHAKAERELGFSPRPLDATLERTARALRDAGELGAQVQATS